MTVREKGEESAQTKQRNMFQQCLLPRNYWRHATLKRRDSISIRRYGPWFR